MPFFAVHSPKLSWICTGKKLFVVDSKRYAHSAGPVPIIKVGLRNLRMLARAKIPGSRQDSWLELIFLARAQSLAACSHVLRLAVFLRIGGYGGSVVKCPPEDEVVFN